jgi:hypothetical protein
MVAITGHKVGWPERDNVISSPLTPFFCLSNSKATEVAAERRWTEVAK